MGTGLTSYQAAERLKYESQQTGKAREADYYETLRTQAWTTKTGKSAAEHTWGRDTGLPQRANPYEYTADLFTYAEKGYPTRSKDVFSPVDFNVLGLSEGKGGQAFIWGNEKYDLRGAMDVIAKAERGGDLGPYGALRSFSSGYGNLPLSMQQSIGAQAAESRGEKVSFTQWGLSPEQMGVGKYVPSILKNISNETAPLNKISSAGLPAGVFFTGGLTHEKQPVITTKTEWQSGAIPFLGVVPILSPIISAFQPMKITKTVDFGTKEMLRSELPMDESGATYTPMFIDPTTNKPSQQLTEKVGLPYLKDGMMYQDYQTHDLSRVTLSRKNVMELSGQTPITAKFQEWTPTAESKTGLFRTLAMTSPFMMPGAVAGALTDKFNPQASKTNAYLEGRTGIGGKYEALREDPAMFVVSLGLGSTLGFAGGALRSAGVGTNILTKTSTAGKLYMGASEVVGATAAGIYLDDLTRRATGSSIGEWQHAFFPRALVEPYTWSGVPSDRTTGITQKWKGFEHAAKTINVATMTEVVPFIAGVGIGAKGGDYFSNRFRTKGMKEIPKPEEFTYFTEEGYPTSQQLRTSDLVESFTKGTYKLYQGKTTMTPSGKPLTRMPIAPQSGVPAGQRYMYSGAETPHLVPGGVVGSGASEIPVMFHSPSGQAHWTKAGLMQGSGGLGASPDVLGIYRNPIMYRTTYSPGDIVKIPKHILNTPMRGMSINDPMNPRNIAITNWMEAHAPYGKPIVSQYGKPEWQAMIREGSEYTTKPIGFFTDTPTGRHIVMEDVVFTGTGKTPIKEINPITGKPIGREIARFYSELGGYSSASGSSKTVAPFFAPVISKPKPASSVGYSKISTITPSVKSSVVSSKSTSAPSSKIGASSAMISEISSPLKYQSTPKPQSYSSLESSFVSSLTSPKSSPKSSPKFSQSYSGKSSTERSSSKSRSDTSSRPYSERTPPPSVPFPFSGFGGGAEPSPSKQKGSYSWREVIPIRSSLSDLFKPFRAKGKTAMEQETNKVVYGEKAGSFKVKSGRVRIKKLPGR
jgi:hypothetical protein